MRLREKRERKNKRREQDEQQAQAVDADEIFRADGGNPGMALDELQSRRGGIEIVATTSAR